MWHEARKQERKIRGMMVDYKRRAERRREYYEKIKADPTQFLQLHGRRCKVHLDPAVAQAADSPANMMPWQGHTDNLIDRFDGRAHLDHISEYKGSTDVERLSENEIWEERQASYERYRILVENDFLGLPEEKFLMQIYLEEQFGPIGRAAEEDKKKSSDKKAAIGYVYEDSTPMPTSLQSKDDDDSKKDSDSDIDLDVTVNVDALTTEQSKEMNEHSFKYGMVGEDFIRFMVRDKEEAESLRLAKEAEEEKAMYSGRKSRRERRAFREKKLQGRKISPPSYAARESPTYDPYKKKAKSPSRSRSKSPIDAGKITYITSFGGDVSDESGSERRLRPGFVSSMTTVMGPSLPSKSFAYVNEMSSRTDDATAAATTSLPHFRGTNRRSKSGSQATSSTSITSSTSAIRSRSVTVIFYLVSLESYIKDLECSKVHCPRTHCLLKVLFFEMCL